MTAKPLNRLATLLAGTLLMATAATATAGITATYDAPDGETTTTPLEYIVLAAGEDPRIGLLLPAVQKVRAAAAHAHFARFACEGTVIPTMTLEVGDGNGRPAMIITMRDVLVSSYTMTASAGGRGNDILLGGRGTDHLESAGNTVLTYTGLELHYPGEGTTLRYDCSSGRCACLPAR